MATHRYYDNYPLPWQHIQLFQVYVPYDSNYDNPAKIAFIQIISNIVVFNTLVPISLYVTYVKTTPLYDFINSWLINWWLISVEAIRLGLSFLINWDEKMYYEPNDVPAVAR